MDKERELSGTVFKKTKITLWAVFCLCLFFYCFLASFHMRNPFMFDEVQYSKAAEMISSTGRPAIHYWSKDQPWLTIIAHPALYINLLGLTYSLFGVKELTGYLFGVVNALSVLMLVIFIIRLLFKEEKKRFVTGITAACIYLINPLLARGSLVIDIDSTILMACILFFVLLFIKSFTSCFRNSIFYLSLAFCLCLWAKLATTVLLIPAVFLYLLFSEQRKKIRIWLKWVLVFSLGALIFLITWRLYCRILNLPFNFPFEYTILGRTKEFLFINLYSRLATIRNDSFWLSPFFTLLAVLSIFWRIEKFTIRRKTEVVDFIAIFGAVTGIFYTLIMPTAVIVKYIIILVPLFSVLISLFLYEILLKTDRRLLFLCIGISLLFFIYYAKLFPDPLLILLNKQVSSGFFWRDIIRSKVFLPFAYILPVFFTYIVFNRAFNSKFIPKLALSALVLFVPSSVSLSITQALNDYASFYHYGERGLKDAVNYIKDNIGKEEVIFGRKEFEYYLPQRVYFDRTGDTLILHNLLDEKRISYVVFSDYYENDKGMAVELERRHKKIYKSGNFTIYKIK